jgi:hypothetical protein
METKVNKQIKEISDLLQITENEAREIYDKIHHMVYMKLVKEYIKTKIRNKNQ